MVTGALSAEEVAARVRDLPDPELPFVTLGELGVIHRVSTAEDGRLEVGFTPTFLGCPALPAITSAIADVLAQCGHPDGRVRRLAAPAWSTDRITASGRRRLAEHGIAPPRPAGAPTPVRLGVGAPCPHCGSGATRPHSPFGPTRCQSILRCTACGEAFPYLATV
ncbi:phenylacetate-CoA oxygenase subunit PaaJ [Streptomyces actuosus]|uniref:Phenylacetate-CoA oxygenase subunit PaaJ n=1 Tax=Streptomyces actuosus TaxID=1885 RepID=A0ABS2W084_STRAS|nr:phenylacetate-CoA oxygenase subunit PaaJ [Streptomyces actuosus]